MTRAEELLETFKDVSIGTELTGAEITKRVNSKFGRGKDSVNPADYCYNRTNNGITYQNHLHLFVYNSNLKIYKYLGKDYLYTGYIYQKPKGSCEIIVGEVFEGEIVFLNQDVT